MNSGTNSGGATATATGNRALQVLHALGRAVSRELHMEPLCQLVLRQVAEVFQPAGVCLFFTDAATGRLRLRDELPPGVGESLAGDAQQAFDWQQKVQRESGALCVPLAADAQVKGVLALRFPTGSNHPDDGDAALLELLASPITAAIDNAWLYGELRALNASLEERVTHRTRELAARNEELSKALRTLGETQTQLLQSAKMASLGQMTAGLAHEINNPLAYVASNLELVLERFGALELLIAVLEQRASAVATGATGATADVPRAQAEAFAEKLRAAGSHAGSIAAVSEDALSFLAESRSLPPKEAAELGRTFLAYLERQAREALGPEAIAGMRRLLERAGTGAERIRRLVKDLRTFARLDEAAVQSADLNACVASACTFAEPLARDKGIALHLREDAVAPYPCAPAQLSQVVLNLAVNAIQATPAGGEVTIESGECSAGPFIRVRDTGSGIAPETLPRIFDPFFTTKPVGEGTGLGLSICFRIVQAHGGEIRVESQPGHGSTFTVQLPARREAHVSTAEMFPRSPA